MYSPLGTDDYPNLDPGADGLTAPYGYGSVDGVPVFAIVAGAASVLSVDISSTTTTVTVDDVARYGSTPFVIQAGRERMNVTGKSGNDFTVGRGHDGTEPSAHSAGSTVYECLTEYVYLVSPEPVHGINAVYVDDILIESGATFYTGQSGDEHTDWPGKAVVAFSAQARAVKQYNADTEGQSIDGRLVAASRRDLLTSGAPVVLGGTGAPLVWARFNGEGTLTSATFSAAVENNAASVAIVRLVVEDAATGAAVAVRYVTVPASASITASVDADSGDGLSWDSRFSVAAYTGCTDCTVSALSMTGQAASPVEDEQYKTYSPPVRLTVPGGVALNDVPVLDAAAGPVMHTTGYGSTSHGAVKQQKHTVTLTNGGASDACAWIGASDSGTLKARRYAAIPAGGSATVSIIHTGASWGTSTRVSLVSGECRVEAVAKTITYLPDSVTIEADKGQTSTARAVIGKMVTVSADWAVDETGDYGGSGSLIERPDWVIKHWLIERMGFTSLQIDATSFGSAGSSYASAISGGYLFGFVVTESVTPSEFVRRLAAECRSTLVFRVGEWFLDFIPDTAPAADATITTDELAGEFADFVFRRGHIADIRNSLTGVYRQDYKDSGYLGTVTASDAGSTGKYGTYPETIDLWAIRAETTAQDVLDHMLLQRAVPLLVVEFRVFWDRFDLAVGDTVDISHELWSGEKFFIERIERESQAVARITARQWWS